MSLRVIARFQAKASKVEELKQLLSTLPEPTRAEQGCILYELLQNTDDPTDFTFVEEWTGAEALEAHLKTDHIANVLSKVGEFTVGDAEIRTYHLVK